MCKKVDLKWLAIVCLTIFSAERNHSLLCLIFLLLQAFCEADSYIDPLMEMSITRRCFRTDYCACCVIVLQCLNLFQMFFNFLTFLIKLLNIYIQKMNLFLAIFSCFIIHHLEIYIQSWPYSSWQFLFKQTFIKLLIVLINHIISKAQAV